MVDECFLLNEMTLKNSNNEEGYESNEEEQGQRKKEKQRKKNLEEDKRKEVTIEILISNMNLNL